MSSTVFNCQALEAFYKNLKESALLKDFYEYLKGQYYDPQRYASPLECNKDYCTTVRNNPYCAPEGSRGTSISLEEFHSCCF